MKKNNRIHEYQVTVTGFQPNGVPVSMDMLVHANTESAAMFKAEDILMNTYGIDNAITESIELTTYPIQSNDNMYASQMDLYRDDMVINWTYFTGRDLAEDDYISL